MGFTSTNNAEGQYSSTAAFHSIWYRKHMLYTCSFPSQGLWESQKNKSKILPQKTMRGSPQASWRGGRQMVQTRTTILTRLIMLIPIGFGNKTNDKKQIMTQILR